MAVHFDGENKRKMKEYSADHLECIGRGATSRVYRLNPDTILKVFDPKIGMDIIRREMEISRTAFVSGIATAIPFEIVRVGDSYGTVYELIDSVTLSSVLHKNAEKQAELSRRYVRFMKETDSVEPDPTRFPSAKKRYLGYKAMFSPYLDPETYAAVCRILDAIPEGKTFSHGDFHPNNILIRNDEFYLIDMGEASVGSPLIDIMAFGAVRVLADLAPDELLLTLSGMARADIRNVWEVFVSAYFPDASEKELERINGTCLLFASVRALALIVKVPRFTAPFLGPVTKRFMELYHSESPDIGFLD